MAKKTSTRAQREAREAKSTLFTSAQLAKAGLSTYSPSYVQKQYTALLKTLSDEDRKALEANRAKEGFTKQDALLYYKLQSKHDAMRHEIEDEVLAGTKIALQMERIQVASRRGREEHNVGVWRGGHIDGVPTPFRPTPLLKWSKESAKSHVKNVLHDGITAEAWKKRDLQHLRKSVNKGIDFNLWGASQQDELRFLISKMTPQTLEIWALQESSATTGLNLQAFSEIEDEDVDTLESVTSDLVEQAKDVLKKYQNYTSRKYK